MHDSLFSVWEGVFKSFEEAGGDHDAFESDIWIAKQKDRLRNALESLEKGNFASKDYPLPLVVGMLLATREKLSVLDFGGGMGLQYLEVIAKVPVAKERLDYYIMDGNASIQNRPDELNQFNKLKFISNIEDLKEPIDIIHIGSTLQYVNDWKFLIFDLKTKYQPMYFVFSDLLAGDVPTFVSHQIFYEKRIPVHMLNIDEFISFMKSLGFDNSYQSLFQSNILGRETLSNFELPENKRIRKTINIIFRNNIAIHDEIRS